MFQKSILSTCINNDTCKYDILCLVFKLCFFNKQGLSCTFFPLRNFLEIYACMTITRHQNLYFLWQIHLSYEVRLARNTWETTRHLPLYIYRGVWIQKAKL